MNAVEAGPLNDAAPHFAYGRSAVLTLEGELCRSELGDLSGLLEHVARQGCSQVVLDLSEVSHFDYRGVQPLIGWAERLREVGGDLKLAGLSPYLHAIFRSAGGAGAFDFYAEKNDAVSAFARGVFVSG